MNKVTKIIVISLGVIIIVAVGVLAYFKLLSPNANQHTPQNLSTYRYVTPKGQKYTLEYFEGGKTVDSSVIAEQMEESDLKPGTPMLVSYLQNDLGIAVTISESLNKPFTKTCTGKSSFAFNVDDYEVCAISKVNLLAKVGNDGKYFVVLFSPIFDSKKVTVEKDKAYAQSFSNFDLMEYEDDLKTILKSIHPVN